jgi:uncharacterized membrane protein (DUF485 family)
MKKTDSLAFRSLMRAKGQFLIPATLFFLVFYFMLPVSIICFPGVMNHSIFFGLTPAWLYAFAQFVMVWALGVIYYIKSKRFDRLAEQVKDKGAPQ